ncbi:MAG: DinB family protein [Ktedonobacterales bacterium]
MAEENFTLTTFFAEWKTYQERMKESLAPLTAEQLTLRAAAGLRSVGENAAHIIGCRAGWFIFTMGEDGGAYGSATADWNEPGHTAAQLTQGLDDTWRFMADCLARWSPDDMRKLFDDDWDGEIVHLSRAWIVWHVLEHDLHHGGELSLTLGMHGIPAQFPG